MKFLRTREVATTICIRVTLLSMSRNNCPCNIIKEDECQRPKVQQKEVDHDGNRSWWRRSHWENKDRNVLDEEFRFCYTVVYITFTRGNVHVQPFFPLKPHILPCRSSPIKKRKLSWWASFPAADGVVSVDSTKSLRCPLSIFVQLRLEDFSRRLCVDRCDVQCAPLVFCWPRAYFCKSDNIEYSSSSRATQREYRQPECAHDGGTCSRHRLFPPLHHDGLRFALLPSPPIYRHHREHTQSCKCLSCNLRNVLWELRFL